MANPAAETVPEAMPEATPPAEAATPSRWLASGRPLSSNRKKRFRGYKPVTWHGVVQLASERVKGRSNAADYTPVVSASTTIMPTCFVGINSEPAFGILGPVTSQNPLTVFAVGLLVNSVLFTVEHGLCSNLGTEEEGRAGNAVCHQIAAYRLASTSSDCMRILLDSNCGCSTYAECTGLLVRRVSEVFLDWEPDVYQTLTSTPLSAVERSRVTAVARLPFVELDGERQETLQFHEFMIRVIRSLGARAPREAPGVLAYRFVPDHQLVYGARTSPVIFGTFTPAHPLFDSQSAVTAGKLLLTVLHNSATGLADLCCVYDTHVLALHSFHEFVPESTFVTHLLTLAYEVLLPLYGSALYRELYQDGVAPLTATFQPVFMPVILVEVRNTAHLELLRKGGGLTAGSAAVADEGGPADSTTPQ